MKSKILIAAICSAALLSLASCAKPVIISSDTDVDTDECATKEEICAEAEAFQSDYQRLPEEEQKEMLPVLNSYIEHCEQTQQQCNQSKKRQ